MFEIGQRVRLVGSKEFLTVAGCTASPKGWRLFLLDDAENVTFRDVTPDQVGAVQVLAPDGGAEPKSLLAALWCQWMRAASRDAKATTLATSPLRPYAHQTIAVYGRMLPQPCLRFLLADEPGTGKTVMAGMYLREMQRLGLISRALIVAPAHLVSKWQADFLRFFGGGLRRITNDTIREGALQVPHDLWVVSLELAAQNPTVQDAIRPDRAGWDAVVFDEAHRLTPSARNLYRVGRMLAETPRALLMTATPHRGKEDLFRSLMHLVDPQVYPEPTPGQPPETTLKPGRLHFLRRMKEDLFDYDGQTRLFKGRQAKNEAVALSTSESGFYNEAQDLVDRYFPTGALTLARMVYGKRAASSLFALKETLLRRRQFMGADLPTEAARAFDPEDEDPTAQDEARVIYEQSNASAGEKTALNDLIARLEKEIASPKYLASKWPRLVGDCLAQNGIQPGNGEQAVVFTEFADSAQWLVGALKGAGFSAERYSGQDSHHHRDEVRRRFADRQFQVLVSTDAGNEGIDLQTAHVLVNWDIPWSLVRLEQRMGRIHRVGQTRDVRLYNMIATGTREGDVLQVLLENFVVAANRLNGKVFDSLSVIAEKMDFDWPKLLKQTYEGAGQAALAQAQAVKAEDVESVFQEAAREENALKSTVETVAALGELQQEMLERINPSIIEAFLHRLARSGMCSLKPHALGEGIFHLSLLGGRKLPRSFGHEQASSVVIATSALALAQSHASTSTTRVVALGPSEAPFRDLVAQAQGELRPSLFQGGALRDASSATDYSLFVYEMSITESAGARRTTWPLLVRVDETGARAVRWELLANLEAASDVSAPPAPSAAWLADAEARAEAARSERLSKHREATAAWLASAKSDLERLVVEQASAIKNRTARVQARQRLEQAASQRLEQLRSMTGIEISEPKYLGWAHIQAGAPPPDATEKDSELIAMKFVAVALRGEGWAVADVHFEGRGYDLHATRGTAQKCVEVKGVWNSAASQGIHLTGNEILMARQLADNYWLWVVDGCQDKVGRLFGRYSDPAVLFEDLMKDVSLFRVPGSALKAAREGNSAP